MTHAPGVGGVAAIVLAAGSSSRMGRAKQLLPVGGRSLVRHAVEVARAAGCAPVIVVLGAHAEAVRVELAGLTVCVADNPAWSEGLSSSVRCGIRALPETAGAAILLLCDQPAVTPGLLARMIETRRESGRPIVACRYAGTLGAPVLFARERFEALLSLHGDEGARRVVAEAGEAVAVVEFPEGDFDLDTREDWARWQARSRD